ncbi:MAG TPA: helix-turn-helix transcriptional regulator [Ilumatobacteraceae bacterium]|nr:helix-turn-helix transcriptional regulator [Ilumatobacteraceae bacterium]
MRTAAIAAETRRHRDELIGRVERADDIAGVFFAASRKLRQLVPHDAAAWIATDPKTGLPTGPTWLDGVHGVSATQCAEHWRREFIEDDVNRFVDLARAERPAGALRTAAGDPERSRRFRSFVRPLGFDDELRLVLRVGDATWGTLTLWRRPGQPAFSAAETALLASLSTPFGDALRRRSRPADPQLLGTHPTAPGVLVFDGDGALLSLNDDARAWLSELPDDHTFDTEHGAPIPLWLTTVVLSAGSVNHGHGDGTAWARIPSRRGTWLACHASCLRDADGTPTHTVVTIELAPPADVASIAVDAYDLSERERQVAASIARGKPTAEIADELYLSAHTVRDHVKSIFRKTGVTCRGELVAKLYSEHYQPEQHVFRSGDGASTC